MALSKTKEYGTIRNNPQLGGFIVDPHLKDIILLGVCRSSIHCSLAWCVSGTRRRKRRNRTSLDVHYKIAAGVIRINWFHRGSNGPRRAKQDPRYMSRSTTRVPGTHKPQTNIKKYAEVMRSFISSKTKAAQHQRIAPPAALRQCTALRRVCGQAETLRKVMHAYASEKPEGLAGSAGGWGRKAA